MTFVAVAGNIGSGKSSLTLGLSRLLGWRAWPEAVDENPYLSDFYGAMARWAFHVQVYFLARRFQHHREILRSAAPGIQDRTIYEDGEIFARNLFDSGLMSERDHATYAMLFAAMVASLRPPDLLVFLDAPVEVLLERIRRRGRSFEQEIPAAYVARLNERYRAWADGWNRSPIVRVNAAATDFALDERGLRDVADQVREALEGQRGATS